MFTNGARRKVPEVRAVLEVLWHGLRGYRYARCSSEPTPQMTDRPGYSAMVRTGAQGARDRLRPREARPCVEANGLVGHCAGLVRASPGGTALSGRRVLAVSMFHPLTTRWSSNACRKSFVKQPIHSLHHQPLLCVSALP